MSAELSEDCDLICLREFLNRRVEIVQEDYFEKNKNVSERVKKDMNLTDDEYNQLEEMCNPELLKGELEGNSLDSLDSEYLSVIDYIKKTYGKNSNRIQSIELKFRKELARLNESVPEEGDMIKLPDIVLTVQLSQSLNVKLRKLMWSEDFLVLGESFLSDLKDKITCYRNEIRIGEFSENPDQLKSAEILRNKIGSGFFFIEDTFYNDLRNDNNDCSGPFIKAVKEKCVSNLKTVRMETTKFIDLNIRLGFPYLYTHLGNCEHILIFTSVKLVNPDTDCYCRSKYPLIKDKTRGRFNFCWCCNKLYAKWVVFNSKYAVEDPTLLCERCLRNTHYELIEDVNEIEANNLNGGNAETQPSCSTSTNHNESSKKRKYKKLFNFKAYHFSQI